MEHVPEQKEKPTAVYTALFVKDTMKLIEKFTPRHEHVYGHHSTIEFMPDTIEDLEVGKESQLKIIGRASDEKCDVLLVDNPKSKNTHPHITLSCIEGVRAVYANELLASAIEHNTIEVFDEPVLIDVVEGYNDGEKDITN